MSMYLSFAAQATSAEIKNGALLNTSLKKNEDKINNNRDTEKPESQYTMGFNGLVKFFGNN